MKHSDFPRCPRCGQEWKRKGQGRFIQKPKHSCILQQTTFYNEEYLYLDCKWYKDRNVVWNLTTEECWIGTLDDVNARAKNAIKMHCMLPYTISKSQLGKYLLLV